jgi:hypothetical protein
MYMGSAQDESDDSRTFQRCKCPIDALLRCDSTPMQPHHHSCCRCRRSCPLPGCATILCRLASQNRLFQDSDTYVLCNTGEIETIEHIFFDCPFASDRWTAIHVDWDASLPLQDRFTQARLSSNLPFFTEATLIAAWELWKLRNDKIFQRRAPTLALWLANFKNQGLLQSVCFRDDVWNVFLCLAWCL